eukprot:6397883-Alexandrium_andersonii.AAC.1
MAAAARRQPSKWPRGARAMLAHPPIGCGGCIGLLGRPWVGGRGEDAPKRPRVPHRGADTAP